MIGEFFIPERILTGEGALERISDSLGRFGKKALLVTGRTVCRLPGFGRLTRLLSEEGIGYTVFSGITGEPDDAMIREGVRAYREGDCDFLIAMGAAARLTP